MQDYHKLDVWTKAHELALEIFRVTTGAADGVGVDCGSALRQAAAAVPLHLVAACGHADATGFAHSLRDAERSVDELSYRLLFAHDAGTLPAVPFAKLEARANQLRAMLGGFNRTVSRKLAGGAAPSRSAAQAVSDPARGVQGNGSSRRESRR